jgi:uncharacterized small protein (DUF1192 family)
VVDLLIFNRCAVAAELREYNNLLLMKQSSYVTECQSLDSTALSSTTTATTHATTISSAALTHPLPHPTPPPHHSQPLMMQHPSHADYSTVETAWHQLETARRKLKLVQEKLSLDQELLKQDKRNFARRTRATKLKQQQQQQSLLAQQEHHESMQIQALQERIRVLEKEVTRIKAEEAVGKQHAEHDATVTVATAETVATMGDETVASEIDNCNDKDDDADSATGVDNNILALKVQLKEMQKKCEHQSNLLTQQQEEIKQLQQEFEQKTDVKDAIQVPQSSSIMDDDNDPATTTQRSEYEGINAIPCHFDIQMQPNSTQRETPITSSTDSKLTMVLDWEWERSHPTILSGLYTGTINDNHLPHGHGSLRWDDGAVYMGDWHEGVRQGHGVWVSVEGDVYQGLWDDDCIQGQGTFLWSDGRWYQGTFLKGQRHGKGWQSWPYGAHYQGDFCHDKRHGCGTYVYADGRKYVGEYQDERPHGQGTLWVAGGDDIIHQGQWEFGEYVG